jgi:hypothetical protein
MKTYHIEIAYDRRETIEVEAETAEAARELVANGEFSNEQIISDESDLAEILEVREVKQ